MKNVVLDDGSSAVLCEFFPKDKGENREMTNLVNILKSKTSEYHKAVEKGSLAKTKGANYVILLAVETLPDTGHETAKFFMIKSWVNNILRESMPNGFDVVLTQEKAIKRKINKTEKEVWIVTLGVIKKEENQKKKIKTLIVKSLLSNKDLVSKLSSYDIVIKEFVSAGENKIFICCAKMNDHKNLLSQLRGKYPEFCPTDLSLVVEIGKMGVNVIGLKSDHIAVLDFFIQISDIAYYG